METSPQPGGQTAANDSVARGILTAEAQSAQGKRMLAI